MLADELGAICVCVGVWCVGIRVWIGRGASAWEPIVEFRQEMGVNIEEWGISSLRARIAIHKRSES